MIDKNKICPVILCGGSGTRLWPISRSSFPKQFAQLTSNKSQFQETIKRIDNKSFNSPIIVSSDQVRFLVEEQLKEIGTVGHSIIIEPTPMDTAPAMLAAAVHISNESSNAQLLFLPSDHRISNVEEFQNTIINVAKNMNDQMLVTFGIKPSNAETAYGWLEMATEEIDSTYTPRKLVKFIEKPGTEKAKKLFKDKRFFWNSGMLLVNTKTLINEYQKYMPDTFNAVSDAHRRAKKDLGFIRLEQTSWEKAKKISTDYGILEKSKNLFCSPLSVNWSDIGDWRSLKKELNNDLENNLILGNSTAIECSDTMLRNDDSNSQLVGIGLQNIVAINTKDAVLVSTLDNAQKVKKAVEILKDKNIHQAEMSSLDFRPWGSFEVLSEGKEFKVKKLFVNPGGILSLQSHEYRSEHWVIVEGSAKITLGKAILSLTKNESVYVEKKQKHRIENDGKQPLIIIEVQNGSYLGEDDIIRYEDYYNRN